MQLPPRLCKYNQLMYGIVSMGPCAAWLTSPQIKALEFTYGWSCAFFVSNPKFLRDTDKSWGFCC